MSGTYLPDSLRPNAVVELLSELFKENSAAETELLNEYLPRLTRLAAKLMRGFSSASEDEDDIAQSTFKSFFRQIRAGQVFEIPSDAALWALLAKMAKLQHSLQPKNPRSTGNRLQLDSSILEPTDAPAVFAATAL